MLALLLFNIVIIWMIIADVRLYYRTLTPFSIIALIYVVAIDLNNLLVADVYGYYKVTDYTIWCLFWFLTLVWLIDLFFGVLYRNSVKVPREAHYYHPDSRMIYILFTIGVLAYLIAFVQCVKAYGFENTKGNLGGIFAHIASFGFILGPMAVNLALEGRKRFLSLGMIALAMIELVIAILMKGKYVVLINATYFLLFSLLKRSKQIDFSKVAKTGAIAVAGIVIAFGSVYKLSSGGAFTINQIFEKIFHYLMAPIVCMNYAFRHPAAWKSEVPFTVFINIYRAIAGGEYVDSIYWNDFDMGPEYHSNVAGIFAETVYDLGFLGTILYVLVVFAVISAINYLYRSKGVLVLSNCYLLAMVTFFFFANFITLSGVVLPLMLAIAIDIWFIFHKYLIGVVRNANRVSKT